MAEKDFFITAIPMIELQGSTHIPTVVYYQSPRKALIGYDAKAASEVTGRGTLNEDFKIDIGKDDPSPNKPKRRFRTACGDEKSAGEMTGDFVDGLLRNVRESLPTDNASEHAGIVIAEPLTMQGEEVKKDWLENYRDTLRRILLGKNFTKDKIDFMPEPFAVFQYYKYGLKHPLLGAAKHVALVIDFGGGSFDVCIIETDKEGEVTGKRKNTRPMGASSAPVGGYYINRVIAEVLYFKYAKEDKDQAAKIKRGLKVYGQWRDERDKGFELRDAKTELQNFAHNFHNTIYDVEESKLTLCNAINNWELNAPLSSALSVPVRLPRDPFSNTPSFFNAQLSAADFREVFVEKIWDEKLKPIVWSALQRGLADLQGAPVTVILLSGGSCNIRWLENLLMRDFASELEDAQVLQLEGDFQEVVAKGVAIECARRFFDKEEHAGDFSSITYNRLHLVLDPDQKALQLKVFSPTDGNPIQPTNKQGVLLPSASVLRNHFDKPLTWRVRLDRPPRQFLDYYFLRTGFTPQIEEELTEGEASKYSDDLVNLEHRVFTPQNCPFDSSIHVELKIERETKTAKVRFVYAKETVNRKCYAVDGKPFFLDMTDTQDNPSTKSYIGLDFGTSNTSASFVSQEAVITYQKRSADKYWQDLDDAHKVLPYPLAVSLAKFLPERDVSKQVKYAREFVEAALGLAAYLTYFESCMYKGRKQTHLLKSFTQRSVGPLWDLMKRTLEAVGKDAKISAPYKELVGKAFYETINEAVTFLGKTNHGLRSDKEFKPAAVQIIANISQKVFSQYQFGFFENVQQEAFKFGSYKGRFRSAHGSNITFTREEEYVGSISFPNNLSFLVNFEDRTALPLYPLIFWYGCDLHSDEEHCFFYDKPDSRNPPYKEFTFKAAGFPCTLAASQKHAELAPIFDELNNRLKTDLDVAVMKF